VLYLPAKLPVVQAERGQDSEKIGREQIRSLRMNGLLIDDPEIIGAMEKDIKGLFIPASLKSGGGFKKHSSIASLKHFGLLKKRIDSLLIEMAQTLKSGDIAAYPAAGEVEACKWCDYKTICGHEFADPVRFIEKRDNSEVLSALENHGN
jgi:ATP-dependent helicase/nuclease subunit B